ncbi:hypothetical protein MSAN_02116200 [Mycena sanguinolenta]|uniref:F-box domain-containing protein n=1 Tax=Mycena sanguinolenta TaxID=230812 RepID=A0A8H6XI13_9AGAR|nr:hypothetical protein MSAN_02116200 [Mycena sanguinolenta]
MEEPEESIGSQFFAIQELLLLVLSYISPPGKGAIMSSIDTNTLANLARVSRNISMAALDALWRSVNQPDTLIRLLPPDAYELSYTEDSRPQRYKLRRELAAHDFVAFDKYAPRVRFVDFSNSSDLLRPGCELFPYIKNFRNPILPALTDFRWEPSVLNGCIGALHLLSREASLPSQEFSLLMWSEIEHFASESESDAIGRSIDAFNDPTLPWLPDVKKLILRTLYYLPAVDSAIQRLFNLEHFSCDLRVSSALLEHLALLPRLRFLDLRSPSADVHSPHDAGFPALEGLRVAGTLRSIAALLALVSSPQLLSVRLKAEGPHLPYLYSFPLSVFRAFPSPPRFRANEDLHRRSRALHLRPALQHPLRHPLYACLGLQTFRVDIDPLAVAVTDMDIRAMARAWPLLTTLAIAPPRPLRDATPHVRLYALWALARGCPRLQTLVIEVDAGVEEGMFRDEEESEGEEGSASGHAVVMDELTLYPSPCGDPLHVADFLNRAFPRLPPRAFHVYWRGNPQQEKERWDAVTEALAFAE